VLLEENKAIEQDLHKLEDACHKNSYEAEEKEQEAIEHACKALQSSVESAEVPNSVKKEILTTLEKSIGGKPKKFNETSNHFLQIGNLTATQ